MTKDPNDDPSSDFKMHEFRNETSDDKKLILHNLELPMEDLMDQRLHDLIRVEAPTHGEFNSSVATSTFVRRIDD
jgi:hypothetical protein